MRYVEDVSEVEKVEAEVGFSNKFCLRYTVKVEDKEEERYGVSSTYLFSPASIQDQALSFAIRKSVSYVW